MSEEFVKFHYDTLNKNFVVTSRRTMTVDEVKKLRENARGFSKKASWVIKLEATFDQLQKALRFQSMESSIGHKLGDSAK